MPDGIDFYKKTVSLMIALYCRNNHGNLRADLALCVDCLELNKYAMLKLDKCIYGNEKPSCAKCSTHCYKPVMREKIKIVMRYSGKRMLFSHPVVSVKYLYYKLKA